MFYEHSQKICKVYRYIVIEPFLKKLHPCGVFIIKKEASSCQTVYR